MIIILSIKLTKIIVLTNQNHYFPDMTNIVDSHCHLDFKDFQDDLDLVIKNAYNANVKHMLSISVNLEDFNNVLEN